MAPKVKAVLGVMSEAVETMCGWAFCVVAAYSLLFLNLTGKGCLWDSMRGVLHDTTLASPDRHARRSASTGGARGKSAESHACDPGCGRFSNHRSSVLGASGGARAGADLGRARSRAG
jgi:hypothetical protein